MINVHIQKLHYFLHPTLNCKYIWDFQKNNGQACKSSDFFPYLTITVKMLKLLKLIKVHSKRFGLFNLIMSCTYYKRHFEGGTTMLPTLLITTLYVNMKERPHPI